LLSALKPIASSATTLRSGYAQSQNPGLLSTGKRLYEAPDLDNLPPVGKRTRLHSTQVDDQGTSGYVSAGPAYPKSYSAPAHLPEAGPSSSKPKDLAQMTFTEALPIVSQLITRKSFMEAFAEVIGFLSGQTLSCFR